MNLSPFKNLLQRKERDLLSEIAALNKEAQFPDRPEVGDRVDQATTEVQTNDDVEQGAVLTLTLAQVRAALHRMDAGTYGRCAVCGRQIEQARLEAIPWTNYCLQHRDQEEPVATEAKVGLGPWSA